MSSLAFNSPTHLKSYAPDLEVIVGDAEDEKKSFMYHGAILANASEYIDTMLSMPMKEQQTRSISFPDIKPEKWLKWTQYVLVPAASVEFNLFSVDDDDNNNSDAMDVLQFYDKYQFRSGINLIDSKLSAKMENITSGYNRFSASDYSSYELVIELMLRICKDEIDLPLSKRLIPKFIASIYFELKPLLLELSEANVKVILPYLFQTDEKTQRRTIGGLVDLVKGVSIEDRSLEEMKLIVQEESFVATLKTKVHDVGHNEDLLSYFEFTPNTISVSGGGKNNNTMNGEYTLQRQHSCIKLGVMDKWYAMNRDDRTFVIQSMDGQGST
jgi:hypothetical protein